MTGDYQTVLYGALHRKRTDLAILLAKHGAACTEAEIEELGLKYKGFVYLLEQQQPSLSPIPIVPQPVFPLGNQLTNQDTPTGAMATLVANQDEDMEEFGAVLKEKDKLLIRKEQEIEQLKRKDEQQQMKISRLQRVLAKHVKSLEELTLIQQSRVNLLSFKCNATNVDIDYILKIVVNNSKEENASENEINLLKCLAPHPNIVQILSEFQSAVPPAFLDLFPEDIKSVVTENSGQAQCFLLGDYASLGDYLAQESKNLSVCQRLTLIADVIEIIRFLFHQDIIHQDMNLQNLLYDPATGKVILSNFRWAIRLTTEKEYEISPEEGIGGNTEHLAPEIRRVNTKALKSKILVDYSKQPSFELGILAHEIYFGKQPSEYAQGESMYMPYFNNLCSDDSLKIPELFEWMKELLFANPKYRRGFDEAAEKFESFYQKY